MADDPHVLRGINWREALPFTHLFRGFRIAIHPSKLVLGLVLLLSLYAGGRILDAIWRPRHLAVPNEVFAYEDARQRHVTGTFAQQRLETRLQIERDYAERLVREEIVTDRNAALQAARNGEELGDLKRRIINTRDALVEEALAQRNQALAAARNIGNAAERERAERAIDAEYLNARRAAYRAAYLDYTEQKTISGIGIFRSFFEYQTAQVGNVVRGVLSWNFLGGFLGHEGPPGVIRAIINFFTIGPVWLMSYHPFYFILFALLFLTLWSVFGGAISRIAAVHVARDEKLSVRAALAFSVGKFLSFISAPLIPLIIVLVVGLVPIVAGLLASIPYIGPIFNLLMGALFVLVLAAGFVMTLVLIGTFGGFNLMYPTIAVEGSDSFDAISRSFSYVYARPWRMLLYTLIAIIYGALTYLFVRLFIVLMLTLTHQFVDAGHLASAPSTEPLWEVMWPAAGPRLSYDIDFLTLRWDQDVTAALIAFWVYLVVGMLGAYAISFYFSVNTIIYFLMRREVDATEMDDVYLEMSEEEFADTAPVTGAPEAAAAPAAGGALAASPDAGPAAPTTGGTGAITPTDTAGGAAPAGGAPADAPPDETDRADERP